MNLRLEEQILIKDIFNVSLVADSTTTANSIFLKNFPREIQHLGSTLCTNVDNISLVDHSTYFDSLLM